ncbi:MAG: TetR/AcrR family transcriptional regulator [Acidobacteria bacterium]|nr:TetR/AcrR family transcriptional regulator [Acidobacteriota bacterium]
MIQRILDAATDVFATQGVAGARMDDIAARAGVSKALIYYHVPDKESLYASVMSATFANAQEALREATGRGSDPEERFRLAIGAIADLAQASPHFAPLMLREIATGGAGLPDEVVAEMRKVFRVLGEILGAGVAAGTFRPNDPVITHMLIAGGVLVLSAGAPIRRRIRGESGGLEETAIPDQVASLFLEGIRLPAIRRARPKKAK